MELGVDFNFYGINSQITYFKEKLVDGITPNYQIIVDRVNHQDTLDILVEVEERFFSDEIRELENLTKLIGHTVQQAIGLGARIKLVEPKTIERSMGKAVRVIDKRNLDN